MNKVEFALWGIPPHGSEEVLLLSQIEGMPICKESEAKKLKALLTDKYKCKNVRIQKINLLDNQIFTT